MPAHYTINAKHLKLFTRQPSPTIKITVKIYYGLWETAFKERCHNYTNSFRYQKNRNEAELSNLIWALKKDKIVTL